MKVAVVTEPYRVELQNYEVPVIRDDEVLIHTEAAGICGSDLHLYKGTHAFRKLPAPLGHEICGTVAEVGRSVTKIKAGDRVTVEPQVGCGRCEYCRTGHINMCGHKIVPGTPEWLGTFAEYFPAPAGTVYRLKNTVSYEAGALTEPLAVAVQAMNQYTEAGRHSMAVLGCGTIGLLILAVARRRGFEHVFCTDTAAFNRKTAVSMGADAALDPREENVVDQIKALTDGKGVDLCVVAAGAPDILDQASSVTRKRGQITLIAMMTKPVPFYSYGIVFNEQKLQGSMTYTSAAFQEAVELINSGIDVAPIITHNLSLEDTPRGLEILDMKSEDCGKILIHP